jgi:hypothetical protein
MRTSAIPLLAARAVALAATPPPTPADFAGIVGSLQAALTEAAGVPR